MKNLYKSLPLLLFSFAFCACITQRKTTEAPKGFKAFYQNLVAKYNGYFNANVLVNESVLKLNAQHVDNYTKILDLYPYVAVDNPKAVAPDLDRAIEKVAMVATLHRTSGWTPDCYLILGKSQFLKHDYESAEQTLEYMRDEFDPKNVNKKDKKAVAAQKKEVLKEKAEAKKEKQKEKEQTLKEKRKASEQAAKDRIKAQEDRKKAALALAQAKQRERELARKEGRKPNFETLVDTNAKKGYARTGVNNTPVYKIGVVKVEKPATKPKSYFLKHRPCWQESEVWLARAYTERQEYDDASDLLASLQKNPATFYDVRGQAAMAQANIRLKQQDYEAAIPALTAATKMKNKNSDKMRMFYILGQIQQGLGRNQESYASYGKVLKMSPAYEMEFNTRLNMIQTGAPTQDDANKRLIVLSKDLKNREYNDQIYFALAQNALKNGQKKEAEGYLVKSLAVASRNVSQKTEAYYSLAKLFTESENFVKAKNYYDSTLAVISQNDPRYSEVKRYSENLTDISKNIQIIALQDSLLKIAAMTDAEKRAFATAIKKAKDEAAAAAARAANIAANVANNAKNGGNGAGGADLLASTRPSFFAYNIEAVKRGQREFQKRWGDRKLEDNWNRANKRSAGISGDVAAAADNGSNGTDSKLSAKEIADILKDVPANKEQIAAANDKVMEAQFALGTLYLDKLKNGRKSGDALEKLLQRFPDTKHQLDAWYYLYLAYTDQGDAAKAKTYFDLIVRNHPESTYAKALLDPASVKLNAASTVQTFYDTTYALFKKGDYKTVAVRASGTDQTFGLNNPMRAKFALLTAMSVGHLQGRDAYMTALRDVIGKFADSPEGKRAKEMLRVIEGNNLANPEMVNNIGNSTTAETSADDGPFKTDDLKLHYVIVVLTKEADLENAKISVSDFNAKFNRTEDLKISNFFLSTESGIPVLVIRKFSNKAEALAYTLEVEKNAAEFMPKGAKYEVFATTQDNYRQIINQKSVDGYRKFYRKNY